MGIAGRQFGMLSRSQLLETGFTPAAISWRLHRGVIEEVYPGAYRVAGSRRSWLQDLMAVCLWAGEDAVVSHRAAAALWGLDGFEEGPLEISASKKHQLRARFRIHVRSVPQAVTTTVKGIPVTNPTRTLLDLAAVLPADRLDCVIDDALRRGLTSLAALREMVSREPGRHGMAAMRRLLRERDPGYRPAASEFQRSVRRMLKAAGFTGFVEEVDVDDSDGVFLGRPDFLFPHERVIVEAEGRRNHSSRRDFRNDMRRRNRLTAEHYLVIHVTWDDVKDSSKVLRRIRRALADSAQPLRRT